MRRLFNEIWEYYLSPQSWKWRLEALRTGISFNEVVLSHSMIYSVEQVFLIHKPDGLLLQHVAAEEHNVENVDNSAGMLMALGHYVRDSFGDASGEHGDNELEDIKVGERAIWLEYGPQAILAAFIRGDPPETLRLMFQDALERIHLEQGEALTSFEDIELSEAFKPYLESCLIKEYKSSKVKKGKKQERLVDE